jgi:sterol desaturase/sphingolipid hydroxylase (fatty acid hydroxylase superfamily)
MRCREGRGELVADLVTGASFRCSRAIRIGLLVVGTGTVFDIHDGSELICFYDNGHGTLSQLPLWARKLLFLVPSDFMLYWVRRMFHGGEF